MGTSVSEKTPGDQTGKPPRPPHARSKSRRIAYPPRRCSRRSRLQNRPPRACKSADFEVSARRSVSLENNRLLCGFSSGSKTSTTYLDAPNAAKAKAESASMTFAALSVATHAIFPPSEPHLSKRRKPARARAPQHTPAQKLHLYLYLRVVHSTSGGARGAISLLTSIRSSLKRPLRACSKCTRSHKIWRAGHK